MRAAAQPRRALLYIGTYSSPEGPEGSRGNGKGIYLHEMNTQTGELSQINVFPSELNPSWLALNKAKTHLYTGNETNEFQDEHSGSVSAYVIESPTGRLKLLNTIASGGAGPAHISVHPSGRLVFVANYAGGTVAVLPVTPDGLGKASDVKHDDGQTQPAQAATAPPGSFASSGHEAPHAHMIEADPAGKFVLASDLGLDRIYVWKLDQEKGKLLPNDPPYVALPNGDGPRHFVFHPNGRWVFSLQEESSTIVLFDYDSVRGALTARQTVSSLPAGFAGTNFTSEIRISKDGRFVYTANRLHDSISWFSVGAGGHLKWAGEQWTRGDYPRSFTIDPSGRFLYSCNQRGDAVTCFRVNAATGELAFTGRYTPVGTPACIVFL
jgi:6-phosphogluconolactonase (cycloisomerase 2 family)